MVFCKNNMKPCISIASLSLLLRFLSWGLILWRAKENKLLSRSNLFPHMMWINFFKRIGSHSEHWENIPRESSLMWVQQLSQQPGKQETVKSTLNQRESQPPAIHRSSFHSTFPRYCNLSRSPHGLDYSNIYCREPGRFCFSGMAQHKELGLDILRDLIHYLSTQ